MEVQINQKTTIISKKATLQNVMEEYGFADAKGIAVAVNDTVIPHSRWHHHTLASEDKIIIIRATQGG